MLRALQTKGNLNESFQEIVVPLVGDLCIEDFGSLGSMKGTPSRLSTPSILVRDKEAIVFLGSLFVIPFKFRAIYMVYICCLLS